MNDEELLKHFTEPDLRSSRDPIVRESDAGESALSGERIAQVQSLIEECMRCYMNVNEICKILLIRDKVAPADTRRVFVALKSKHRAFFECYDARVRIKEQVTAFNYLVSQHVQKLQSIGTLTQQTTSTQWQSL